MLGGWVVLLLVVGFAVFALRAATDAQRRAQASQSADAVAIKQLYVALGQTQTQLKEHGITPKTPPPATIVEGIPGAAGQSIVGPQGPAGVAGAAGAAGSSGVAGAAGKVGAIGPQGPAGLTGPVGPAGPSGAVGPVGAQGPAGPSGAQGSPGATGATGPAPSGWSFTAADGTVYDCAPDAAGSTHYSCTARKAPPPPPPSSPTPAPSQSATSPKQASPHRVAAPVSTGPGRP